MIREAGEGRSGLLSLSAGGSNCKVSFGFKVENVYVCMYARAHVPWLVRSEGPGESQGLNSGR